MALVYDIKYNTCKYINTILAAYNQKQSEMISTSIYVVDMTTTIKNIECIDKIIKYACQCVVLQSLISQIIFEVLS